MNNTRECTCGRLRIGSEVTEHRNWSPDCAEHGVESAWWNSDEQIARRQAQTDRLISLQTKARAARERSKAGHPSNYGRQP